MAAKEQVFHKIVLVAVIQAVIYPVAITAAATGATVTATDAWLQHHQLERWELVLDHDGDGFSGNEEFIYGTNPRDPRSRPPKFTPLSPGSGFVIEVTNGVTFGSAALEASTNLIQWGLVPGFPPADNGRLLLEARLDEQARFFRFAPLLSDSDGDGLLDFEELHLFNTDPLKPDTDGDGLNDAAEVLVHHSDPTRGSSTGRGSIRGQVVLDEDRDPATQNHPGIAGWTVFVDLDFDGQPGPNEPRATTGSDGRYEITELDPGFYRVRLAPQPVWAQIFPTTSPPPTPDGYPDRVVEVFDSGTGPIPFPYGRYADPLPGQRLVFPSPPPDPVDASVVLGALPPSPIAGPFGGWSRVDILAIPSNSFVTVAFDGEEIFDGPGPDLAIWCAAAAANDSAELSLGSTATSLTVAGVYAQAETILVDLAALSVPQPVRYLKLRGLGLVGTYPGIDLVGFEALHFRPLSLGHYDVTIMGGQTVDHLDFGVAGTDRPPRIAIGTDRWDVRAGESLTAQITATDDVGVAGIRLAANGIELALDTERRAVVPVTSGGLLTLEAAVTDTAGQKSTTVSALIARNADGSLPDLSGLGARDGSAAGGPSIQVSSPVAGEILAAPHAVLGSITSTNGISAWQVHYAPADAVNPEALDAPDSDYVLLAQGNSPVIQGNLGTLPADSLPAGAYMLRITAADAQETTRYAGFVVGVRVDPLDIRPAIIISAPTNDAAITYLTNVIGNITTRQVLREWSVEYAPLSAVNLLHLSDPSVAWTRLAHGTNAVTNSVLARFDPTLLPNDAYVLRVSAWNRNGLGWTEPVVVQVSGNAKLGQFAVDFTDVDLLLAGIPVRLTRSYNSLNANRRGDFGYGWSLGLQDADIAETVPQAGRGLGSTPFRVGARVYFTAPDGRRIGFTFEPQIGASSFLGAAYKAVFKPDPGVRYTLQVPEGDQAFLSVQPNGDVALFFLPVPWNPDTYVLTDLGGTQYTYDQSEGLIEIRDTNGNRVTFNSTAITHSAGPTLRLARDSAGRIVQVTAPDGRVWGYQYSNQGDLAQVAYPSNLVATFGYSTNRPHFLETINDPLSGPALRTEYDESGRVRAVIDAQGNRREQNLDPGSFTGTYTDARSNITRLTCDARGNLTRRETPLGGITTYEYKNTAFPDLLTAMTDPRGHRTTYSYDARGNRTMVSGPGRLQTTYTYDEKNRVTSISHLTGGREDFQYDAKGNVISFKRNWPNGEWLFTYTASGTLASMLEPGGGLTRFEYDEAMGMPSRVIAPDGGVKHFGYDANGWLIQFTDPLGGTTRFEYDTLGRLVRQINAAGGAVQTTYHTNLPRQVSTVTDPTGRLTRYAYDALGRLTQAIGPNGAVTRYELDADGNQTAIVDPLGNRHEFVYDAMSQLITETDALGRQRVHDYDLAGNRIGTTDRNGRRRAFDFNEFNQLAEERWFDAPGQAVIRTLTYQYDALGRMRSATDPEASLQWVWLLPPVRLLENEQASYAGLPGRRIASTYDNAYRQVGLSSSSGTIGGWSLAFTRDTSGRLGIVTSRSDLTGKVPDNTWQLQLWRNARGNVTALRRFADQEGKQEVSQTHFHYSVPCACHLERIEHVAATNQPLPEATMVFNRDAEGGITGFLDGPDAVTLMHDDARQLTNTIRNGTPVEFYAYDTNGNRTTSHRHAAYATTAGNRLAVASPWNLAYDHEGNLITKSNAITGVTFGFTWDHRNRLIRVQRDDPGPPAASDITDYRYDAIDRRIAVIHGGQTNWTYYDGFQPLMDFINDETTPAALYYTGERLDELHAVWQRGVGAFWTLTDHLGTVRRLLKATNGVEVAAVEFDSFGNPASASGVQPPPTGRFSFTGREYDANTGLYYNRARYYDPDLGRFISEDPLRFNAGDMNLYRYVSNDPYNGTDPLGLSESSESGLMNLPTQMAKQAICEAGAETAGVYISAAVNVPSVAVSAALSSAVCGGGGPTKGAPLTAQERRLNKLLELPPDPPPLHWDEDVTSEAFIKLQMHIKWAAALRLAGRLGN